MFATFLPRRVMKAVELLVLACIGVALPACGRLLAQGHSISEQYLFAAANRDRIAHHLRPLQLDPLLEQAALQHAKEMAARRTISHQFAGEPDLASRAGSAGAHFSLVTENVAEASNSSLIHDLWMQSEGHRANLLDPKVDEVGVAVVAYRGQLYAVEDFAQSVQSLPLQAQEELVGELVEREGLQVSGGLPEARRTCLMDSGFAGRRQPLFVMRYTAANLSELPEELSRRIATGRYRTAEIGACESERRSPFSSYTVAVLLYP